VKNEKGDKERRKKNVRKRKMKGRIRGREQNKRREG
jgi:hypothetical protein